MSVHLHSSSPPAHPDSRYIVNLIEVHVTGYFGRCTRSDIFLLCSLWNKDCRDNDTRHFKNTWNLLQVIKNGSTSIFLYSLPSSLFFSLSLFSAFAFFICTHVHLIKSLASFSLVISHSKQLSGIIIKIETIRIEVQREAYTFITSPFSFSWDRVGW